MKNIITKTYFFTHINIQNIQIYVVFIEFIWQVKNILRKFVQNC